MQNNDVIALRDMLGQLPTEQLDQMLRLELKKEQPDQNSVRLILDVLEAREKDYPVDSGPQAEAAWARYRQRIAEEMPRPVRWPRWVGTAAAAAMLVLVLLAIVPQQAQADGFLGMLSRWKRDFLEFVTPDMRISELDNGYETDHPGLQQVYDAAVAMGIEDPILPQWMEEERVLEMCKETETSSVEKLSTLFAAGDNKAVLFITRYKYTEYHFSYKDEKYTRAEEKNGVKIDITQNNGKWVAIWSRTDEPEIEYSLAIDCSEDTFQRILDSIYVMEAN